MRAFACPVCSGFLAFESVGCPNCQTEIGLADCRELFGDELTGVA